MGNHWFLKEVYSYIVPRLTVLATDSSIDVGYDLHYHIDSVKIGSVPAEPEDLVQILGRVWRADPSRLGRNDEVDVIVDVFRDTLDHFFLKHCGVSAE